MLLLQHMDFKFKNIPKKAFLYAGFEKLSFLRYMTIYSLSKLNKDWEIFVYRPIKHVKKITWTTNENDKASQYTGNCYFDKLNSLKNVHEIIFNFEDINLSNLLPEVHKSDFLRWYLLSTVGGLWSDIDILYHKPLLNINNLTNNVETDCFYCFSENKYHSIGFNLSAKGNTFYKLAWEQSKSNYDSRSYQCIGSHLLNKLNNFLDQNGFDIPKSVVYTFSWVEINKIFGPVQNLPDNNIGIHWFGGSNVSWQHECKINVDNFNQFDNIICDKIKYVLNF